MEHSTTTRSSTKPAKVRKTAAKTRTATRRQTAERRSAKQAPAAINKIKAATVSTAAMLKNPAKPLDFVLPGLLLGTVNLEVGPGGVGKSNFALQNSVSVAIGRDVFNFWGDPDRLFKMKKGKVIYISAEDGEQVVTERLKSAYRHLTRAQRKAVRQNLSFVFATSFSIVSRREGLLVESDWIRDLHAALQEMTEKPRLIVIDTLNRSLGDANENSTSGMTKVEEALKIIAETYNCGVQLVHHTIKGTGDAEAGLKADVARGSSAAVSNVRSVINLSPDDVNPNVIWYAVTKANYGPKPPTRFAIRSEDGVLFGSAHHPDKPLAASAIEGRQELVGGHEPFTGRKGDQAPKVVASVPLSQTDVLPSNLLN
jgi:hypothetical protein